MAKVLTAAVKAICPHGGTITFTASQQLLKIDNQAALVQGDEATVIINCPNKNTSIGQKPCTKITLTSGMASSLAVNEKPVLLETASGTTDGVPPLPPPAGLWSVVSAGQTKLDAV